MVVLPSRHAAAVALASRVSEDITRTRKEVPVACAVLWVPTRSSCSDDIPVATKQVSTPGIARVQFVN